MKVACYGPTQFDDIPWPQTDQADVVRRYVAPLVHQGTKALIPNVDTDMHVALVGGLAIPFTVGSRGAANSYVCAPQSQYVEYIYDEVEQVGDLATYVLSRMYVPVFRWICSWGEVNRVVMVNNWLLSTNLYPEGFDGAHARALADVLRAQYPDHAILFRSIDLGLRQGLHDALAGHGARMVLSRRVHIVHHENTRTWKRNNIKNDIRLANKTPYELVVHEDLTDADFDRLQALYTDLYIHKYSGWNPRFTSAFMRHLWREKLFVFAAYRRDGRFDAVSATLHESGVGTGPIIGYDRSCPAQQGLYRLAYLEMMRAMKRRAETIHGSAGVARYKQLRGAESYLEYNAVFDAHLPWRRRLPWRLFQILCDRILAPMMLAQNL